MSGAAAGGGAERRAAEIVDRIRAGDPEAEAELVRRCGPGLSYLLRRLAGDPTLAEDLAQETLRVVIEKARRGEIRHPERLGGFVRGTAKRLLMAERRRRRRRRSAAIEEVPEPPDPAAGPFDRAVAREDRRRVRRLLAELGSERDREAIYRIHLAEEDRATVARDLGLSRPQLSLVLFRARQRFKELLQREGLGEHGVGEGAG